MLDIDINGPVATITLARPERRNALNADTARQLQAELRGMGQGDKINAVILAGAAPCFCAGSDLKELAGKTISEMRDIELAKGELLSVIYAEAPPVIAAVEGFALGGGFALAAACDHVVTADDARWHMPEAQNGWIPPWGLDVLDLRVGRYKARQLVLGKKLSGAEAAVFGIADRAVPAGQALAAAREIAAELAALAPHVIRSIKRYYGQNAAPTFLEHDRQTAFMFADDCRKPPATTTLEKFGVRNEQ